MTAADTLRRAATVLRQAAEAPDDQMHCITQSPDEPAAQEYLDVCDNKPAHIACSIHCPVGGGECGGHPICDPCYQLGLRTGLIREEGNR